MASFTHECCPSAKLSGVGPSKVTFVSMDSEIVADNGTSERCENCVRTAWELRGKSGIPRSASYIVYDLSGGPKSTTKPSLSQVAGSWGYPNRNKPWVLREGITSSFETSSNIILRGMDCVATFLEVPQRPLPNANHAASTPYNEIGPPNPGLCGSCLKIRLQLITWTFLVYPCV